VAGLPDYTGEFDPEFGPHKLSQEALLRLLGAYPQYMMRMDGLWYFAVIGRWGDDAAFECDAEVWERLPALEMRLVSDTLGIRGDDVLTVMKALQASLWRHVMDLEIDLKSSNHAIVTFRNCPTLAALEKEGRGRENLICRKSEPRRWSSTAAFFNPKIRVTPLTLPPRAVPGGISCQWEYKLEA